MLEKRILLVEPGYRNKYPPLGLMKLSAYHKGRGDFVRFAKLGLGGSRADRSSLSGPWDRVYVTTLFSFEWKRTAAAIDEAIGLASNQPERVFVGGIAASLMHDSFLAEPRWAGVRFIKGILDGPPATALQLSLEDCEFGAEDLDAPPIDELTPDYGILTDMDYVYPVRDAYFGFASRGCVRKCSFCGVPKLEGAQREMPPIAKLIEGVDKAHGPKKDLVLMDNNITASSRYREVIAEIRGLGFIPGATLARDGGPPQKRRVDFNQGVDARILSKSPMFLKEMASICISPLRIAFDHIGMRKVYETAVRMAADNSILSLSNYMLFNFMDSPKDLYDRMALNIALNEELGIRIWSFPMRYQPIELKDRSHVGKRWNRYFLRSFQLMLQATHGIVSGSPSFFRHAYGESGEDYERLLSYPHAFIFHRDHYETGGGQAIYDEYRALRARLSEAQQHELIQRLSEGLAQPSRQRYLGLLSDSSVDASIREVIRFHTLSDRDDPISDRSNILPGFKRLNPDPALPAEDELVEDAGLFEDTPASDDHIIVRSRADAA